jgi:tetratricopeptide (TPR) repeat protein
MYEVAARFADFAGDAKTALERVARARALLRPGDPQWVPTYLTEGGVQMWSGHIEEGKRAYEAALAQRLGEVGPDDPEIAAILSDYAVSLLDVNQVAQALETAERASRIIHGLVDPNDDRIDPIRVNLAATLIGAQREDEHDAEALELLTLARANNVRRLGENNTVIANIDSNLATIYNRRGQYDRAIASLKSALAIDEKLIGPDQAEVAIVLYNLAAIYRAQKDYPAALTAARRSVQIHTARSPGSDRQRIALTMVASIANDAGDFAQALDATGTALGFAKPAEDPETAAWAQLERGRALIGLGRGGQARPLLETSRATYARLKMTKRIAQVDDLLAHLPR